MYGVVDSLYWDVFLESTEIASELKVKYEDDLSLFTSLCRPTYNQYELTATCFMRRPKISVCDMVLHYSPNMYDDNTGTKITSKVDIACKHNFV